MLYPIVSKRRLHETVTQLEIAAPQVARKAQPGQFIILRIDERGERIPLTIAGYDRVAGIVTIIFQKVGGTTRRLDALEEGEALLDFVGPLGRPSDLSGKQGKKIAVIGGGLGIAIAYPQAKALHQAGADVDIIVGFRSTSLFILMDELKEACTNLYVMTDDGSNGRQGFVTTALEEQLGGGVKYDEVIAIGPLPMMRGVCNMTREYHIPTVVSMNPIMIDGTGMCGGCRLTVGGETKFACVDGPEFDGHLVDFDEAIARSRMYQAEQALSQKRHEECSLMGRRMEENA